MKGYVYMRKFFRWSSPSSLSLLYDEFNLPQAIRRSLSLILLANLFGNLHGIICGGGTTAMVGLANELKAGDLGFGFINGIPQAAALLQIPFSILVDRTHRRKKDMLTVGIFSRALWILFGLIPLIVPANPSWLPLWTMIFLLGEEEIERRVVSGEDYAQFEAYWEMRAKGFSGYDFNYHVYTQEMADKLEEIAVKHGLKLRHEMSLMWQNIGEVDNGYEREEITAAVDQICAGGKSFFRTEPTGYDKFYFYDEGTFAVSFFTTDELSNLGTSCYLYNSPYGTLSSGTEIFDGVKDIASFSERTHTTPDGTVLTVLENGTDMFAYVYLENSFVTLHIVQLKGLSEAEVDAILDMVDFSTIS